MADYEAEVEALAEVIGCEWIDEFDEATGATWRRCDQHARDWPCIPGAVLASGLVTRAEALARLAAIDSLHNLITDVPGGQTWCGECGPGWPCLTRLALDAPDDAPWLRRFEVSVSGMQEVDHAVR